jgi:hypothetical protein
MVRTNYCNNPSFESNTTSWSILGAQLTGSQSTDQAKAGTHSLKLVETASGADQYAQIDLTGVPQGKVTLSAWMYLSVYTSAATGNRLLLVHSGTTGSPTNVTTFTNASPTTGQWVQVSVSTTVDASGQFHARLYAPQGTIYWDAVLIEASNTVGDTFDGASSRTNHTYAWSGTANNSTSTDTFNGSAMLNFFERVGRQ